MAPAGLVVRDHSAAAPPVASTVARGDDRGPVLEADAQTARGVGDQLDRATALEHVDLLVLRDERAQLADQAAPGRRAAGVHDAPRAVAALQAE